MKCLMLSLSLLWFTLPLARAAESMDQMWGDSKVNHGIEKPDLTRGPHFRQGRYGLFMHWGLYPMGVFEIRKADIYKIEVSLVDGDSETASLDGITLTWVQ